MLRFALLRGLWGLGRLRPPLLMHTRTTPIRHSQQRGAECIGYFPGGWVLEERGEFHLVSKTGSMSMTSPVSLSL